MLFVEHAKKYVEKISKKLNLNRKSFVVEIASNDGYLLKFFKKIPCLGIEPTKSTYKKSLSIKIPTLNKFFGTSLSKEIVNRYRKADLVIGNNVYAHVPDINDFTKGIKNILNLNGTVTLEFPHLFNLVKHNQFDTIYHEHYSYLSLYTVRKIFAEHNLKIFHVEKIFTHGGSLRVYGCHQTNNKKINKSVSKILTEERNAGLLKLKSYKNLQKNADKTKLEFINFLKN